jgi:O-antigen/teichoic acid export membrane protein
MRKILYKNSVSGVFQLIFTSILTLLLVTIFTKYLGTELYGLFSIVSLIGNINVFTNFGLNSTLIKFILEQGKTKESNLDITVTLIITGSLLFLISLFVLVFNKYILLRILNVPLAYFDISAILYFCLIFSNFFTFLGLTFSSVIDSQHKIFLTNILQMIYNLLYTVTIILFILLGYSLDVIGLCIVFASLVWFILITFYFFKIWGRLQIDGLKHNFIRIAKKQIKYGLKIYTSGLIGLFYEPLTKIFISHFLGIKEVGYFDIILKVRNQFQSLVGKIYYPILPLIAQTKENLKLRNIVHDIEQKAFICVTPILASVILCASPFTKIWIGQNSLDIIIIGIIIITSSYLIASFTVIPFYQYLMIKKATITIYIQFVNVSINTVLIILTYQVLGFYSIFIASSVAIFSSFFVILYYQKKLLNSNIFDSFSKLIKIILTFLICFSSGLIFNIILDSNILKLIIIPFVTLFAFLFSIRLLGLITIGDLHRYFGNNTLLYEYSSKFLVKDVNI